MQNRLSSVMSLERKWPTCSLRTTELSIVGSSSPLDEAYRLLCMIKVLLTVQFIRLTPKRDHILQTSAECGHITRRIGSDAFTLLEDRLRWSHSSDLGWSEMWKWRLNALKLCSLDYEIEKHPMTHLGFQTCSVCVSLNGREMELNIRW